MAGWASEDVDRAWGSDEEARGMSVAVFEASSDFTKPIGLIGRIYFPKTKSHLNEIRHLQNGKIKIERGQKPGHLILSRLVRHLLQATMGICVAVEWAVGFDCV